MLSVIKTAIITIIISFISGVLLDTYKNLAPKIICTLGKGTLKNMNGKSYREYNLTVKNASRKTLHDLNINIQDELESIVVKDTRIKKGLRFNLNKEFNEYNITVPFLSENDEFIATIIVEETKGNKPYVALRSPEKFRKTYKEIKSNKKSSSKSSFNSNLHEGSNGIDETAILDRSDLRKANCDKKHHSTKGIKTFISRKIILAVIGILVLVYIGILGMEKVKDDSAKIGSIGKAVSTQSQQKSTESPSATSNDNNKNKVNEQVQVEKKTQTQNKANTSKEKDTSSTVEDNKTKDNVSVQEANEAIKENENTNDTTNNTTNNTNASAAMNTTTNSNNNTNIEEKQSTSKSSEDEKNNTSKNNSDSKNQNSNVKNNADSKFTDTINKVQ